MRPYFENFQHKKDWRNGSSGKGPEFKPQFHQKKKKKKEREKDIGLGWANGRTLA
jgi:hypothetical protein